jgi:uncharacterized protein YyaL (SSP411 family)
MDKEGNRTNMRNPGLFLLYLLASLAGCRVGEKAEAPQAIETKMAQQPSQASAALSPAQGKQETGISGRPGNHLLGSTSPYLLQHAHNPVDWYPWGEEALQKAKSDKKPIFLSVGYSACHWCHVMEREDFENEEIARILNANFICIKVDREERPDIDAQYLLAVQLLNDSAGWPMSVWLTPDLKPFYGGTYYPPDQFKPLLEKIAAVWRDENAKVLTAADRIASWMQLITESSMRKTTASIPAGIVKNAIDALMAEFDRTQGGFGSRPKFPQAPRLAFLLDQNHRINRPEFSLVTKTLDGMALGGIYDQIGGGFHRYSTDAKWRIPHFEKMLYDQAQMACLYLDAYEITQKPRYRQIAVQTLDFVLREMTDTKTGGFYSTLDADSEGQEGKYYVWTPAQLESVLGKADAERFAQVYGVTAEGSFESHQSVLALNEPLTSTQETALIPLRSKLLEARSKRVRPNTDDKILTAWNGLMIAAFARGYQVTGSVKFRDAAIHATDFIAKTLTKQDGTLIRGAREGKAGSVAGFLDDYAYYAVGLLTLYDATQETRFLTLARTVVDQMIRLFWDKDGAGGFLSRGPDGAPVKHQRDGEDNATPSPNGIAAQVLIRLAKLPVQSKDRPVTEASYLKRLAAQTIQVFQPLLVRAPAAFPTLLVAWQRLKAEEKPALKSKPTH